MKVNLMELGMFSGVVVQQTPDYPGWSGNVFPGMIETPDNQQK
jgi:hypothetical protein